MKSIYGKGLRAVLGALYEHKSSKLSFREACRLSKLTQPTVLKHLKKLESMNIIKSERFKNLRLYSFNQSKSAFQVLAALDTEFIQTLPKIRRDAIEEFTHEAEPRIAVLFGSTAKGTFRESSDVDLLLVYETVDKTLLNRTSELASKAEARFGVQLRPISMPLWELKTELNNKENFTLQSIRQTGRTVKNGEEYYELTL